MPDEEPGFAPAPEPAREPLAKATLPLVVLVLVLAPLERPEPPLDVTVLVPPPALEPLPATRPALPLEPVTFAEPVLAPLPSPFTRPPQDAAKSEKTSERLGANPLYIVN
jgi:hypothetical protein